MEEINLRDFLEVVYKARWLIAGVTLVAMLVSGAVSFFALTPTYEATATVLVSLPPASPAGPTALDQILSRLSGSSVASLDTYRSQVTGPAVLSSVIKDLGLNLTASALAAKIKTTAVKNTGLIEVSVTDENREVAAQIANQVAKEYVTYADHMAQEQVTKPGQAIEQQMTEQEMLLSQATADQENLLRQAPSADELQQEVDATMSMLAQLKTSQVQLAVNIQRAEATIGAMAQALQDTPDVLVTKKSISDDSNLQQLASSLSHQDAQALAGLSTQSEEVNPTKTALASELAEKKADYAGLLAQRDATDAAIAATEKNLGQLQAETAGKQLTDYELAQKVAVLKATYEAMERKYEEVRLGNSSQLSTASISIVSEAVSPSKPTGPHRTVNVVLAGVLGLMVSVFLAFFLDFWRNTSPSTRLRSPARKAGGV